MPRGIALLALVALCSCRGPAGTYQNSHLRFDYLSGWSVSKDELVAKGAARVVNIQGPHHAVLTIALFAKDSLANLRSFAASMEKNRGGAVGEKLTVAGIALGSEKKGTGSAEATARIAGEITKGIAQHFAVEVVGVEVPHEADFYQRDLGSRKVIFMNQVADKHAAATQEGFQRIYDTVAFNE